MTEKEPPAKKIARKAPITSRIIRPGDPMPAEDDWKDATIEERMAAVWELTRQAYAWNREGGEPIDELRLQRSFVRIHRPWR